MDIHGGKTMKEREEKYESERQREKNLALPKERSSFCPRPLGGNF